MITTLVTTRKYLYFRVGVGSPEMRVDDFAHCTHTTEIRHFYTHTNLPLQPFCNLETITPTNKVYFRLIFSFRTVNARLYFCHNRMQFVHVCVPLER